MKVLVRPATLALMVALSLSACGADEESGRADGSTRPRRSRRGHPGQGKDGQGKSGKPGKGGEKAPPQTPTTMPADFPAEVPLVKGKIRFSSAEPGSWVVTLDVTGDHDKISDRAVDQVLAAGFEEQGPRRDRRRGHGRHREPAVRPDRLLPAQRRLRRQHRRATW